MQIYSFGWFQLRVWYTHSFQGPQELHQAQVLAILQAKILPSMAATLKIQQVIVVHQGTDLTGEKTNVQLE